MKKSYAVSLLYVFYLLSGTLWISSVKFLPEGDPKVITVITISLIFIFFFLWIIIYNIRHLLVKSLPVKKPLFSITINFFLMITAFAIVYSVLGIYSNISEKVVHSFDICIYYSVVTFTTLGYGDFYPVGIARIFAAIEGLTGFMVLGIIASTAASVLTPGSAEDKEEAV